MLTFNVPAGSSSLSCAHRPARPAAMPAGRPPAAGSARRSRSGPAGACCAGTGARPGRPRARATFLLTPAGVRPEDARRGGEAAVLGRLDERHQMLQLRHADLKPRVEADCCVCRLVDARVCAHCRLRSAIAASTLQEGLQCALSFTSRLRVAGVARRVRVPSSDRTSRSRDFTDSRHHDQRRDDPRAYRRHRPRCRAAAWIRADRDMWVPWPRPCRDHTVIVPDLRGMGLSLSPAGGFDKKTQADDRRRAGALGVQQADRRP